MGKIMITPADLVWITLIDKQLEFCREIAQARQDNALDERRAPRNHAHDGYSRALAMHMLGLLGEAAGMIYLSPCTWHHYKRGDLRGLSDINDFIDVKTCEDVRHRMIVQDDDPLEWAYIFACAAEAPKICLVGWCWGRDAKVKKFWDDPGTSRPAYWVPRKAEILRPMSELRIHLHGRGAR
jgi:hypothetical protein